MLRRSQRGLVTAILLAIAVAAGSGSSGAATTRPEIATAQPPLIGTWQRLTTCSELATALRRGGQNKWVLEFVAGNGFLPGVMRPDQIKDPRHPCKGAVSRRHSHFFTKSRKFGSLDWTGQQVDDGTYRLVGNRTVVIFKEFPKVTFNYRIRGRTITFAPGIPKSCSTFRCAWAISMAYPGRTWQRVR